MHAILTRLVRPSSADGRRVDRGRVDGRVFCDASGAGGLRHPHPRRAGARRHRRRRAVGGRRHQGRSHRRRRAARRPLGATTIDASGLIVAPGFIDLHTHSEMPLLADGTAQSKVRQGVTLDIMGESTSVGAARRAARPGGGDGVRPTGRRSPATSSASKSRASRSTSSRTSPPSRCGAWSRATTRARRRRRSWRGCASSSRARWRRAPGGWSPASRAAGPSIRERFSRWRRVVAAYGGNYTSHTGSEGFEQTKELEFAIRVAEEAKIPVHIFHFKVRGTRELGHDRPLHQAARRRAGTRPEHHRQSVSLHGDVPRLERVLPGVDARGRSGEVRRAAEGSGRSAHG